MAANVSPLSFERRSASGPQIMTGTGNSPRRGARCRRSCDDSGRTTSTPSCSTSLSSASGKVGSAPGGTRWNASHRCRPIARSDMSTPTRRTSCSPFSRSARSSRAAPGAPHAVTRIVRGSGTARSYFEGLPGKYRCAGDGALKVLLVTRHFPPGGGGGVQRPLKFATHLPALGIETHVLAPELPGPALADAELELPTQAWIHRVRYVGPRAARPSEELVGKQGIARVGTQAALFGRKLLVPDENAPWSTLATPVAIRLVRREGIDVVLTTSPPPSLHLLGAAVKRTTGAAWVADLRDPLTSHPHRRGYESQLARLKEKTTGGVAKLVASQASAIVAVSDAIAEEMRALEPKGKVVTIANGCDFDDFAGLEHHASNRLRITHAGHFHGKRDPKPFLRALADSGLDDVVARFAGDFRAADREYAESLGLGDRIELLGDVSRRRSLELQRDSEALLLLIPESGGRGRGVLTGKIFEYLAAERPILAAVPPEGAAAKLVPAAARRRGPPRSSCTTRGPAWSSPPMTRSPFVRRCSTSTGAGRPAASTA